MLGRFYATGEELKVDLKLKGVTIRSADGVTGACAIKQGTKAEYLAYVEFVDVETWADLKHSYDALFIFTSWANCRDGYSGTPPASQTHSMIKSVPAAYGQVNQLNLNQMYKCQMFRSNDPNGCLHIEYGSVFSVVDSDFEQLDCRAINARGILNLALTNNWYGVYSFASNNHTSKQSRTKCARLSRRTNKWRQCTLRYNQRNFCANWRQQ